MEHLLWEKQQILYYLSLFIVKKEFMTSIFYPIGIQIYIKIPNE
jgi:hypothetical protein